MVRILFAALVVALPLTACSSGADLPMLNTSATVSDASYRLGPGDKLHIGVVGSTEVTGDYTVSDSGVISIALIGDVHAAKLTGSQLEKAIAVKLADGYMKNPQVTVAVLTYRPFYVLGEVFKPGTYPYASGMRVMSAVATAGGYTPRGRQDYVIITRDGKDGKALPGTSIQPDDVIRVPERLF
jgi:protein involved in polysaccharide export with SLBB domain